MKSSDYKKVKATCDKYIKSGNPLKAANEAVFHESHLNSKQYYELNDMIYSALKTAGENV